MTEGTNNSLINLGDIAKPADTLIKKVSKAVGGLFEPYQIKRIAKAEAEAAVITAQAEIQISALHRRAMSRFIEEEAKKQQNIEDITSQAIPLLQEKAEVEQMNDDWVTNFFDKSRIVSDQEMQVLWARVLAGEANAPGTYSKRTVNLLGDLDKFDAEVFTRLCGFSWMVWDIVPLIFDSRAEIYLENGINFNNLSHLESIGLIRFQNIGFRRVGLPKLFPVFYRDQSLLLDMPKDEENELELGQVLLTKAGQELARICVSPAVDGFFDYVRDRWKPYIHVAATE